MNTNECADCQRQQLERVIQCIFYPVSRFIFYNLKVVSFDKANKKAFSIWSSHVLSKHLHIQKHIPDFLLQE